MHLIGAGRCNYDSRKHRFPKYMRLSLSFDYLPTIPGSAATFASWWIAGRKPPPRPLPVAAVAALSSEKSSGARASLTYTAPLTRMLGTMPAQTSHSTGLMRLRKGGACGEIRDQRSETRTRSLHIHKQTDRRSVGWLIDARVRSFARSLARMIDTSTKKFKHVVVCHGED